LEPFFGLSQTGRHDDTVQERVVEKVLEKFLDEYSVVSDNALQEEENAEKNKDDITSLIFKDVHVKTVGEFIFTMGSDPDTKDKYRKSLYDLHKKYMRRLKKIGKDVLITTDEDGNELYKDEVEGYDDVTLNNIDESIQFLEAETNDEMPSDAEEDADIEEEPEKVEMPVEELKKDSKKKKKKRKSIEKESELESEVSETIVSEKRKKKKKKKSEPVEADADEEVVISLTEQQDAKKKDRKAKKKLKEQKEAAEAANSEDAKGKDGEKHVSFGKKNRAKSHTASMKALRTSEPPTKETVPEKSILRVPKHSPKTSGKALSKKQRKKAKSYF